jgi:hypothetical protein
MTSGPLCRLKFSKSHSPRLGLVTREGGLGNGQPAVLPCVEGRDELGAARGLSIANMNGVYGARGGTGGTLGS